MITALVAVLAIACPCRTGDLPSPCLNGDASADAQANPFDHRCTLYDPRHVGAPLVCDIGASGMISCRYA